MGTALSAHAALLAQAPPQWREFPIAQVTECRMVFDAARGRFVAVASDFGATMVTLEWAGSGWQRRDPDHTLPVRTGFGLAYDSVRGVTVLFGGNSTAGGTADLFEYDGGAWTLRDAIDVQPSPRTNMACAWSPLLQAVMVVGGSQQRDSWSWNGTTWSRLPALVPVLARPAMAFHAPTQRMVLFDAGQTWLGNATSWTPVTPTTTPLAFGGQSMCADLQNGTVRMFGGAGVGSTNLWSWNGSDWSAGPALPESRSDAGLAADLAGNTLLFGGFANGLGRHGRGDTWTFTTAGGWRLLDAGPPIGAATTATIFDLARQRTVVVWGEGQGDEQLHEWDGSHWFAPSPAQPQRRIGAAYAYDLARNRTMRFGGALTFWTPGQSSLTDDQYSWDGASWAPELPTRPPARAHHAMCCDLGRAVVVLFGGTGWTPNQTVLLNDTWEWNGAQWQQVATQGPSPRADHAMAFDTARAQTLLFGGSDGTARNDTWSWNGSTWTQLLPAASPLPRSYASLQYDTLRNRVQLIGGFDGFSIPLAEHWEFDGTTWLQRATNIPFDANILGVTAIHGDQMLQMNFDRVFLSAPSLADAAVVGSSCGATLRPQLQAFGQPILGAPDFALEIYRGRARAPALLVIGAGSNQNMPIGYGCTLLVASFDLQSSTQLGGNGHASFGLPVPPAPALIGIAGTAQAAALDPRAPLGFGLTNGVTLRIGN